MNLKNYPPVPCSVQGVLQACLHACKESWRLDIGLNIDSDFPSRIDIGLNTESDFPPRIDIGLNIEADFLPRINIGLNIESDFGGGKS